MTLPLGFSDVVSIPGSRSSGQASIEISFDVRGLPIAQGTGRAFISKGRAIFATEANQTSRPLGAWRAAIATEARQAIAGQPVITGRPVEVRLTFRLPRPQSHFLPRNSRRPVAVLRPDAPTYHIAKPDGDKLTRAAFDAITGVVLGDDSQVADFHVVKRYVAGDEGPGVEVRIATLEDGR